MNRVKRKQLPWYWEDVVRVHPACRASVHRSRCSHTGWRRLRKKRKTKRQTAWAWHLHPLLNKRGMHISPCPLGLQTYNGVVKQPFIPRGKHKLTLGGRCAIPYPWDLRLPYPILSLMAAAAVAAWWRPDRRWVGLGRVSVRPWLLILSKKKWTKKHHSMG